ncbi:cyanophycinase [Mucilaginibacter sp. Bleaf8]|uniref:cyanophycinase n=1 Tax=Mucilaginibacter sp. Bleaf8 TaxID=2834430 RepID=UPI001BCCA907|nr:cyanophycinase [Mucilaginibacter sp. Bleaf8]MBS7564063.1 cyanophycinase [Mucilaginibacter sp. Bleaf8]
MDIKKDREMNSCPVPNGILVIIGGAEDKGQQEDKEKESAELDPERMQVLKTFMEVMGVDDPHIEVITSASSEGEESFKDYQQAFQQMGAKTINHIHHDERGEINFGELEERLNKAHGVFFSGGDQLKLTSLYGGTKTLYLLKQRYIHDGLIIAGTSAGAMAMSTPMIYQGVGKEEMIAGHVKITTGLEFLRDVCIDTHFVNRGRFVRMAQVIATNPTSIGMGIEENTAVIIRNGKDAEIIGGGVVIIINGYNSRGTNIAQASNDEMVTIRGLQVDILSKGEKYEIPEINPPHK